MTGSAQGCSIWQRTGRITEPRFGTLVRHLQPERSQAGVTLTLQDASGTAVAEARWLS